MRYGGFVWGCFYKELTARMKEWRHYLHAHPETALEEKMTSEYIADILRNMGLEVHTGIGVTGVVAVLKAGDGVGKGCDGHDKRRRSGAFCHLFWKQGPGSLRN